LLGRGGACCFRDYHLLRVGLLGLFEAVLDHLRAVSQIAMRAITNATHVIQTRLEFVDLCLFDEYVLFVQFLDDVFVVVLAVDVDQHGFDGRIALDERAWSGQRGPMRMRGDAYLERL